MVPLSQPSSAVIVLLLSSFAFTQPQSQTQVPPQTSRQALIEMIRGGGDAIAKHLTVEMEQAIGSKAIKQNKAATSVATSEAARRSRARSAQNKHSAEPHTEPSHEASGGGMIGFDLSLLSMPPLANKNLETFDSGPVLLTYNDPSTKEKIEVRVENDDLRGMEDDMQLSVHLFKDGQEQTIPFLESVTVGMKQQEGIWRLNEISTSVRLRVGDPKFFEEMKNAFQPPKGSTTSAPTPVANMATEEEHQPIPIASAVTMLAFAEDMFARSNPDIGFTCNLADLVGEKGSTFSGYLDPQIATGSYNGYRFSISGCESKPSEVFHLIAEPLAAGSKAYCINATHNLRASDDGRGATCITAGRAVNGD